MARRIMNRDGTNPAAEPCLNSSISSVVASASANAATAETGDLLVIRHE